MTNKHQTNATKYLCIIFFILLLVAGFLLHMEQQKLQSTNQKLRTELIEKDKRCKTLTEDIARVSTRYNVLYKEKNGTANAKLIEATNRLFSAVYNYDTSKKIDSVKSRKERGQKIATAQALESLFPKDSDETTPSVTNVSKLEQEPEIYMKSSDSNQLCALVLVHYSYTIAGSEKTTGSYLYQVTYDQFAGKFTSIKNVAETDLKD